MVDVDVVWSEPLRQAGEYRDLLDAAEHGRFTAYRRDADRLRFLTGRVLAKHVAADRMGTRPAAVVLDATCADCGKPHGKPSVSGAENTLQLSLSHAGDRVVVAATPGVAVGVDVEATTRSAAPELIRYALNDDEQRAVATLPPGEREDAFFTYWSRKEAAMKATGRGLKIPLRGITLSPLGEKPGIQHTSDPALAAVPVTLADLDPGPGYRASVAVLDGGPLSVTERWWHPPGRFPSPAAAS